MTDSTPKHDRKYEPPAGARRAGRALRAAARGVAALVVLGLGLYAAYWFNATEGRVQAGDEEQQESARLVETATVQREDRRVVVRAMGTVTPARQVILRPRVSGKVVQQHEDFVPGGRFDAGQFMIQIDQADYRQALQQRRSELEQAKATLKIERGDQAVAREELALLEEDIAEINRDLILRKPQVRQAEASVESAEAAVSRAESDLERTRIEAPFDGHIVARSVSVGDNVSQGDQLATFVGSERYWVELAIPLSHMRWITIPSGSEEKGSVARITHAEAWGEHAFREGRVTQLIGRLEAESRLAQVVVSVPDPLARDPERKDKPQMILDAFVDVRVKGRELEDVAVIDRAHLREDDVVWVMNDDERLETRDVSVAFRGRRRVYITSGLEDGDRVIATNLQAPVEGMLLRTADDSGSTSNGAASTEGASRG